MLTRFDIFAGACVALVLASGLAACAAVLSVDDVGYLQPPEAGPEAGEAGEAGTPDTGGGDAPVSGCGHSLCDDFGDAGFTRWTRIEVNGGTLDIDDKESLSPPSSLHATAVLASRADVAKQVDGGVNDVTCTLAVFVDQIGDISGGVEVLSFGLYPAGADLADYNLSLHFDLNNPIFYEFGTHANDAGALEKSDFLQYPDAAQPFGAWITVKMQATLSPPLVFLYLDSRLVLSRLLTPPPSIQTLLLRVGTASGDGQMTAELHFDDVICDWK